MSSHDESVTTWLVQLKAGRSTAAEQLWRRYIEQLVRLARRKLGRSPRRAADEEDVALSAFDNFLQGVAEGRFPRLDDRDDLWQVLVMLTERRAIALRRREHALKRGGGRIRGESALAPHDGNGWRQPGLDQAPGREPTPAFAAQMTDETRRLLNLLADDTHRQVALGKLAGWTNKELSQRLGMSLRGVERKLAIIRDKWTGEFSADESF